ncbi:hypothetical protein [Haloarcula sp. CBA1127]|uniref:hypothetical protein n=1 Tax=Haloarcula sp. CBA1127 TaxID=1765055 RepID=UPI00073F9003|nr:hypothetical protein [Haloarcula sp. CBA1127]
MPDTEPLYDVHEQTENPDHASVDDVVDLVLERAQNPRNDHEDGHFDTAMATIIETYGIEPVRTVIYRVLVDNEPFRTATTGLELRNVDGLRIGTTAGWFLNELNARNHG